MHLCLCAEITSLCGCSGHRGHNAWTAILAWCILGIRETWTIYSALLPLMFGVVINTAF